MFPLSPARTRTGEDKVMNADKWIFVKISHPLWPH
jgi:hypothetical protein